jgi:acyl-CoA synthetase (NDP forming)
VLPIVAKDPAADLFFINIPVAGAGYDVEMFARDTAAFAESTQKPVAVSAWQEPVRAPFRAAGLPVYANEAQALGALVAARLAHALLRQKRAPLAGVPTVEVRPGERLPERGGEPGAPRAPRPAGGGHRLCRSAAEARAAFARSARRSVVKACSVDIPHKSEHGLVAVNVRRRRRRAHLRGAVGEDGFHGRGARRRHRRRRCARPSAS